MPVSSCVSYPFLSSLEPGSRPWNLPLSSLTQQALLFFPTIAPCVQDLHPPHLFTSHLPAAKLEPPTVPPPPASSDHSSPSPTTRANSWKHGTASSHFPAPKPAMPAPPPMHTALAAVVGGTQWGNSSRAFKGRC